jgi:hypothetical protein
MHIITTFINDSFRSSIHKFHPRPLKLHRFSSLIVSRLNRREGKEGIAIRVSMFPSVKNLREV